MLPTIDHPTDRPNFTEVTVGDLTIWYSYATPIAYRDWSTGTGIVVRQNDWSNTTGRHLAYLDDGRKKGRIPGDAFEAQLNAICARLTLTDPTVTMTPRGDGTYECSAGCPLVIEREDVVPHLSWHATSN